MSHHYAPMYLVWFQGFEAMARVSKQTQRSVARRRLLSVAEDGDCLVLLSKDYVVEAANDEQVSDSQFKAFVEAELARNVREATATATNPKTTIPAALPSLRDSILSEDEPEWALLLRGSLALIIFLVLFTAFQQFVLDPWRGATPLIPDPMDVIQNICPPGELPVFNLPCLPVSLAM